MASQIPGYKYGSKELPAAPVSDEEFKLLKTTVLMTDEDIKYLRMAGEVLKDQVNDVLDLWYGWVGSHKHLVHYFGYRKTGQPIGAYLEAVRKRFGQWILDTCFRDYDREWLNYQYEIGRRHHREKKNKTDGVDSVDHIPLRYLIAFIVPITATIKPFLAKKGHSAEDVEKMYNAWFKAVALSVVLWSIPYTNRSDW
ncbi:MAG: protoglobin domain-containing protein [Candidatus Caldarchaeum sp.]